MGAVQNAKSACFRLSKICGETSGSVPIVLISDTEVRAARLTLRNGPVERTLTDQRHPFEFSVPAGELTTIDYHLQFERADGTIVDGGRHSVAR